MIVNLVHGSIPGEVVGVHVRSRTVVPTRVCEVEGCAAVLSIYNPKRQCAIHWTQKQTAIWGQIAARRMKWTRSMHLTQTSPRLTGMD